ncbi:MAG: nitrate reductase molybdenum cofactor assembly chaperone [Rubrivivax sp.]|jgi:nitrate reductase delta subunit|nr:nitrate reductase molybdenum cofactor assembly chaperone [Rubrivivax sp.]
MNPFASAPARMAHTLRALAWLLRYPDTEMRDALPEVRDALHAERALPFGRLAELDVLVDRLRAQPALRAEADYVGLFDRGRRTSLHLFEHVHGDSRDRGQAMIDLAQTYERSGLLLADGELPDYLPVVLEFASTQPPARAREFLGESAHIVRAVLSALLKRQTAYASVLAAVLDLAGEKAEPVRLRSGGPEATGEGSGHWPDAAGMAERVELPDERPQGWAAPSPPPEGDRSTWGGPASTDDPPLDDTWAEPEAFGGCSTQGQSRSDQPQPIHVVRPAPTRPRARAA